MSGVYPNVRGALAFAVESQDVISAATVAIGVPELGVETSAEIDGQLFVVLSALTEGESFDIVMSAGSDHGIESLRKLDGRWNPYTAGRARSFFLFFLNVRAPNPGGSPSQPSVDGPHPPQVLRGSRHPLRDCAPDPTKRMQLLRTFTSCTCSSKLTEERSRFR